MALKLYNTMGHKMQEFKPIVDGHVGFYGFSCLHYEAKSMFVQNLETQHIVSPATR